MTVDIEDIKRNSLGHIIYQSKPCPYIIAVSGGLKLALYLMDNKIPFSVDIKGDILVKTKFLTNIGED
jgi:hypothetical protein